MSETISRRTLMRATAGSVAAVTAGATMSRPATGAVRAPAAVRELEEKDLPFATVQRKYGINGCDTVQKWARRYGNGSRGKVVRVEKPEEISELARLKKRVRLLEGALADPQLQRHIERRTDYQIWCGPAMGAFNAWVKGSFLEAPEARGVVQIARNLLEGAAVFTRAHQLRTFGVPVPSSAFSWAPRPLD